MKNLNDTASTPTGGGALGTPAAAPSQPDWQRKYGGWITVIVILAALCILPFQMKFYHIELSIIYFSSVILAVSYRLVTTTGDWSFAHIILQGVGAYATALLAKHAGIPFIVMVPLAGFVTAAVGAVRPSAPPRAPRRSPPASPVDPAAGVPGSDDMSPSSGPTRPR